ncbi:MAG: copper homeostasis protein CutC [bacterium]|jgi:copper homeostasis protein|nr:copper homeostasis protein CutC [bacterium]
MTEPHKPYILEVCANSVASAMAAQEGGADRVELCAALVEGGITPSWGAIQLAREALGIRLHVLIRPRGGDFCYTPTEQEIMKRDIHLCKELGVDGVVIGLLHPDGGVDIEATREMVQMAAPMDVTFHRAFDMTPDPFLALQQVIETGSSRILTSGQKNKAPEAVELIAELIRQAGDQITILVGSGLNESNVREVIQKTGAAEVHLTGNRVYESPMIYRNPAVFMGGNPHIPEYEMCQTDPEKIRTVVQILQNASGL